MTFKLGELNTGIQGRPCWRKRSYESLGAAEAAVRSVLKRGLSKDATRLNAYGPCQHCGLYHTGHRKETKTA